MATTPPASIDEPPHHFTLIELFRELALVGCVAVGCYAGWKTENHFLAMFVGGVIGRVLGIGLFLAMRGRVLQNAAKD